MKEYQINVIAGNRVIADMMQSVRDKTINDQRMKAVQAGPLPAGPLDKEMFMVLESPGTWSFGGKDFVNSEGEVLTLWWDKVTYSVENRAVLPMRSLPIGLLNIQPGSFNFDIVERKLNISGVGSVNIEKARYLFNTPQVLSFPVETNGYYALLFNIQSLNFSLYVQTNLSGTQKTDVYISTIYLNNSTGVLTVNGIPDYKINGYFKPSKHVPWMARPHNSGDVTYHEGSYWFANQDTRFDSTPGISDRWTILTKFRRAQLSGGANNYNFDLSARTLAINGTVSFSSDDIRLIVINPQSVSFPTSTNGYYALLSNRSGSLSAFPVSELGTVDPRLYFLATFYHNALNNDLSVNGIPDYNINGVSKSFIFPDWVDRRYKSGEIVIYNRKIWVGQLENPIVGSIPGTSARWKELLPVNQGRFVGPANSINFDTINRKITTSGTSAVVIPNERMLITSGQIIDFPTSTSGYYALLFKRSGGVLLTSLISSMGLLDNDLILITTFYHNAGTNELIVNGISDYYVNGAPRPTGQATLERKFSFDIGIPYYNATTDLSMSINDPIVLKDQPLEYLYGLYDGLMAQYPEYITKGEVGEQEDTGGAKLPIYYWRFKPANLIKNTGYGNDERLKIVMTPCTHGGEKPCAMAVWILMDAICNQWKEDEFLEAMRWNCEFVIVACASPYQWKQNTLGLSPGRKNINGVDPNRNYPVNWSGGSDNPADSDYRGPSALSEIETQAISQFLTAEYVDGAIALDVHTFVNSTGEPKDIAWIISTPRTNPAAQAFARRLARIYKKKLPTAPQGDDVPMVRVSSSVSGGMTYKFYNALGYKSYLMEINENFEIIPTHVRNDNYTLKYGTESIANMLREVIKTSLV